MKNLINIVLIVLVAFLIFNSDKIFSYTYNYFFNSSPNKLLCVPNSEKRDYNIRTYKYVKKHFSPSEGDLLISLEENKLTIHRDNGNEDYPRAKINADPSTFLMGFYKKGFKYVTGKPYYSYNGINLELPDDDVNEDIILHSRCGGGNGFLLFKHGVFEQLQYPWFEPTYLQIKDCKDYSMEDVTLCLKLNKLNIDVYAHPEVIVGHEKVIELRL